MPKTTIAVTRNFPSEFEEDKFIFECFRASQKTLEGVGLAGNLIFVLSEPEPVVTWLRSSLPDHAWALIQDYDWQATVDLDVSTLLEAQACYLLAFLSPTLRRLDPHSMLGSPKNPVLKMIVAELTVRYEQLKDQPLPAMLSLGTVVQELKDQIDVSDEVRQAMGLPNQRPS